ncbi:hypothetical protein GQ55_5G363400 [Panicum hallii var. hallii]|uniref:Uncharacterized protein n=1 Tax=Panicum hallii var. hallii TaxID=1504633 RepID=A0A2T7DMG2_9POAL|nr:hypothetical protein GQ55_5G363400 [Panicum hallii var. hallii]
MKTSKNKRRQQQKGRPVLVTFYVLQPRRDGEGGARTRTTLSHDDIRHHHHHHLHYGDVYDERRRWTGGRSQNNRRADLLEYSRQLRALARQTTTTTAAPLPQPLPPRLQRHGTETVRALQDPFPRFRGDDEVQPAAVNRLERAMSQRQIRQRCFGGGGWSWKRVLALIFPIRSNSHSIAGHSKVRRPTRRMDGDGIEQNGKNNQKGWPAALLVGKLTVARSRRDHGGFADKLMSIFQKPSR